MAGVVALAAWRMSDGQSTIGEFMGFISALLFAAQPVRGIGSLSTKVQEGLAAIERIYEIIDEKPAIVDRPGAQPLKAQTGSIHFGNVSFSYGANDSEALSGVTIDIRRRHDGCARGPFRCRQIHRSSTWCHACST